MKQIVVLKCEMYKLIVKRLHMLYTLHFIYIQLFDAIEESRVFLVRYLFLLDEILLCLTGCVGTVRLTGCVSTVLIENRLIEAISSTVQKT